MIISNRVCWLQNVKVEGSLFVSFMSYYPLQPSMLHVYHSKNNKCSISLISALKVAELEDCNWLMFICNMTLFWSSCYQYSLSVWWHFCPVQCCVFAGLCRKSHLQLLVFLNVLLFQFYFKTDQNIYSIIVTTVQNSAIIILCVI